jgi:hypothetical protein
MKNIEALPCEPTKTHAFLAHADNKISCLK